MVRLEIRVVDVRVEVEVEPGAALFRRLDEAGIFHRAAEAQEQSGGVLHIPIAVTINVPVDLLGHAAAYARRPVTGTVRPSPLRAAGRVVVRRDAAKAEATTPEGGADAGVGVAGAGA